MKRLAIVAATWALTGCAASVLSSSPRTVIVQAAPGTPDAALKLAEAECTKYQRHARVNLRPADRPQWVFDCVE